MSGAVVFTIAFRPFYTRETLEVWKRVRGLDAYDVKFFVEPSTQMDAQIEHIGQFADTRQTTRLTTCAVNHELLGVLKNPLHAIQTAFEDPSIDHVILAEEDVEVADDSIEYVQWALRNGADIACMWSDKNGPENQAELRKWFNPWGWALTREIFFGVIYPTWDDDYTSADDRGPGGWDCNIGLRVVHDFRMNVSFPMASRSRHIGKWLGVHQDPASHGGVEMPESFRASRPTQEWKWA